MWYNISHEVIVVLDLLEWLQNNQLGEMVFTTLVSMVPVVELRAGSPSAWPWGCPIGPPICPPWWGTSCPPPSSSSISGAFFNGCAARLPRLDHLVDRLEAKAHLKGRKVTKYKYLGLMLFVAVPLPGTGAWTGALAAAFLDMPLRKALPSIFAGVLIAGFLILGLTYGFTSLF